MNRERAKELLPIIQAFADGEDVQFRPYQYNPDIEDVPNWSDLPEQEELMITFPADDYEYRIKPKPREFWIDLTDSTFIEADKGSKYWGEEHELIKVREI